VNADQLKGLDTWWRGPAWFSKSVEFWPSDAGSTERSPPEERKTPHPVLHILTPESWLDPSRYSSYWKLLRVTAWIFRFIRNIWRAHKLSGEQGASELTQALLHWIRAVQTESFSEDLDDLQRNTDLPKESKIDRFNPFLQDRLICLGGRLQCAYLPEASHNPLPLDGKHHFVHLLIWQTHTPPSHGSSDYSIRANRGILDIACTSSNKKGAAQMSSVQNGKKISRGQQIEAPLPADWVQPQKPFAVTGIVFAGPLYIKVGSNMRQGYIALFTCATTRAVHLELCTDMTTDKFLLAFQRFVGRRGLPHTVYTDNTRTFHANNKHLAPLWTSLFAAKIHQFLAQNTITWRFIAPRAAWWGGWWDRMIGTTKRCLRKALGRFQVRGGLNTTLVAIETAINSRPIVQAEDESGTLTPAHLLIGKRLTAITTEPEPKTNANLTKNSGCDRSSQMAFGDGGKENTSRS